MASVNQYNPQSVLHPGITLAEKLEELNMGPKEFAVKSDKPEQTISAILKGESSITPDMAVKFENVTKIPVRFWLNNQQNYDEYIARVKHEKEIRNAIEWAKEFPYPKMASFGWVPSTRKWDEKVAELFSFFGVASQKSWEKYYIKQNLKVQFRISLANTNNPQALSAWLRKGELDSKEISTVDYSSNKFKKSLSDAKQLMVEQPANFFQELQQLCADAGVKLVHTPCLPKAPLSGATRWLGDAPLIQLTGRGKKYDRLWFTFYHEAGHIMLHGKKDIFLEDVEYKGKEIKKEQEADDFASEWLLSQDQIEEILSNSELDEHMVRNYATKFGTHPSIIIGRLQYLKLIPYSVGNELLDTIDLDAV
tara:strand:+ start:3603 stop:4697 length:1095 start_codon:yes stop_codon:yes gene_type:complete